MSIDVDRIKKDCGIDEQGHCMCCDTSNCCGALPEALDEIKTLSSRLEEVTKAAELISSHDSELRRQLASAHSRLDAALDLIRSAAPLGWATGRYDTEAAEWEVQAAKILDSVVEKPHRPSCAVYGMPVGTVVPPQCTCGVERREPSDSELRTEVAKVYGRHC